MGDIMSNKVVTAWLTAVLAFSLANPAIAAPVTKTVTIDVSLQTQLVLEALDCSNSGGNQITIGGSQSGLPQVNGKVTYKSPSGKPGVWSDGGMLLSAGPQTYLDKRGVNGGVGGNPWIYINGPSGSPTLLGRCVQDFKANWSLNRTVTMPVTAVSRALQCSVDASVVEANASTTDMVGTEVTVTFDSKSPDNASTPHPHKDSKAIKFSLTSTGGYPMGGKHKGIGGNPDVYLNISTDTPVGDGMYLGRCRSML